MLAPDDARTAEKLIALYRYELDNHPSHAEMLGELFDLARVLVVEVDEDDRDRAKLRARCREAATWLVQMLVKLGECDQVELHIDNLAEARAVVAAKFGQPGGDVAVNDAARIELAARWDAAAARKPADLACVNGGAA